ncbi:MAG: MerR family transcriptional regulator [Deltaproteobacteria bacterium]
MDKKIRSNGVISVKDIMRKYNVTYHAVNHYTDFGLLTPAFKKGTVRFYDEVQVRHRLNAVRKLASEGYSLRLIRKKLLGV